MSSTTLTPKAFYTLVDRKETDKVKKALEAASLENKKEYLAYTNSIEETPLLLSARLGCEEIVKLLLEHGANVNALDNDGGNVLHNAAIHSSALSVITEVFAAHDCEHLLTQPDNSKKTVFHLCIERSHTSHIIQFFIDNAKTIETLRQFEEATHKEMYKLRKNHLTDFLPLIKAKIKILTEQELLGSAIAAKTDIGTNNENAVHNPRSFKV